jgi:uncharacterized protein
MYYLLFYKTVDNYIERRVPYRPEHLALAEKYRSEGKLLMGGALAGPADGAVLLFKADSRDVPESFVSQDPYVKNGLITEWSIREWTVVIGNN